MKINILASKYLKAKYHFDLLFPINRAMVEKLSELISFLTSPLLKNIYATLKNATIKVSIKNYQNTLNGVHF